MIRRTIVYSGRVQGVGFRATVVACVGDTGVVGTVRNLADGGVEAIFEGEPATIDAVANRVRQSMVGHIDAEHATDGEATGAFGDFTVRR